MRIPTRQTTSYVGMILTPLIDVVFLLVFFILLARQLSRPDTAHELPLPAAQSAPFEPGMAGPRVTVNLLAGGTLQVASRAVSSEELVDLLADRRSALGSNLEVRIRADRSLPYSRLGPLIDACSRAGILNITFAVTLKTEN